MCYKGQCMYFIKVETGSLIFGILSAILTGLSILSAIGFCIYMNMVQDTPDPSAAVRHTYIRIPAYESNILLLIVLAVMLPGFSFSVVLTKGVVKKNPAYVKAYYNYGVFIIWSILALMCFGVPLPVNLTIVIGVIYYFILRMVRMTYKKLRSDKLIHYGNIEINKKKLALP